MDYTIHYQITTRSLNYGTLHTMAFIVHALFLHSSFVKTGNALVMHFQEKTFVLHFQVSTDNVSRHLLNSEIRRLLPMWIDHLELISSSNDFRTLPHITFTLYLQSTAAQMPDQLGQMASWEDHASPQALPEPNCHKPQHVTFSSAEALSDTTSFSPPGRLHFRTRTLTLISPTSARRVLHHGALQSLIELCGAGRRTCIWDTKFIHKGPWVLSYISFGSQSETILYCVNNILLFPKCKYYIKYT